jgi:hypothetical protein
MSELREVQAYKYYVWRKKGGFPTTPHAFFEQAKAEAERISKKEKDEVFVLAVVGSYKPAVPPPVWVAADYEEALF